jgi:hypothetical protein
MSDIEKIRADIAFYSAIIIAHVWMASGDNAWGAVWIGLAILFKVFDFKRNYSAAKGAA